MIFKRNTKTLYNIYEREKEYKRSGYISLMLLCFTIAVIITVLLVFTEKKAEADIPLIRKSVEEMHREVPYVNVVKLKNIRKLTSNNPEYVIYNAPEKIEKIEEKLEVVEEKKVNKEVKKKKIVKKRKEAKKNAVKTVKKNKPAEKKQVAGINKVETGEGIKNTGSVTSDLSSVKETIASIILAKMEENKKYPRQARRINAEGTAKITFLINKEGIVSSAVLSDSSGYKILDKSAVDTAKKVIGLNVVKEIYSKHKTPTPSPHLFVKQTK